MKHHSYFVFIYFIIALIPSSCNKILDYVNSLSSGSIQTVKTYRPYKSTGIDLTLEEMLAKVAGATGEVSWKSFKPKDFNDRPEINMVQVDIKVGNPESRSKSLLIQYIINENTKGIELYAGEINGKAVEKLMIDLKIISGQLP